MKKITLLSVLLFALFTMSYGNAQKVVIIGMNHVSTTDGFSFVATQNIPAGEVIYFTDNEYSDADNAFTWNGQPSGEAVVIFTVTTNLSVGDVVFVNETSSNVFDTSCSGGCGNAVLSTFSGNGSFALSSNGEGLYAYSGNDGDPRVPGTITEIYAVMFTGSGEIPTQNGGSIPADANPVADYPNAIVVDGFTDDSDDFVGPDRVEFAFDPASLRDAVDKTIIEDPSKYISYEANQDLSIVPFINLNISDFVCTISIGAPLITQPICGGDGAISIAATGAKGAVTYTLKQGGVELASTAGPGTFTLLDAGTYTVVASDGAFPSGVCEAETSDIILVLQDNTPPTASNPATVTVACDGDIPVIDPEVVIDENDNCGVPLVAFVSETDNGAIGNAAEPRIIVRTYSVTDDAGNQIFVYHTINLIDDEPPVIICNNTDSVFVVGTISPWYVLEYFPDSGENGANLTDNCGIIGDGYTMLTVSPNYFTCDDIGRNEVVVTATDLHGNSTSISCFINIGDYGFCPPVPVCKDLVVSADANCENNTVTAADFNSGSPDPSLTYSVSPSGPYPLGTTDVVFSVSGFGGYTRTCTATVTVKDTTPPAITCPGDIIVSNDPGDCGAVVNYKVPVGTDNCSGAITNLTAGLGSGSFFPVGETTETYTVTDATGKQVACSFKVTVVDNEPPVLNCQDFTIELGADGTFQFNYSVLLAATGATDNCGLVSFNNSVSNAFDCSFLGTRPITIFAVDSNGQISSCTVNLTVTDPLSSCCQAPIITCPADVTLQCGDSTDPVFTGAATAIEGCGLVTINYSDAPSIIICGNSLKFLRTWTATDEKGNMDSCTQLIKVMDATPPVLTVPGDVTLECSDDDPQQTDRLTVNSPAGIAGSYSTGIAYFGPVLTSIPITADILLVNDGVAGFGTVYDGCDAPLPNLTGKIALIERGICNFTVKVKNAQDAGALAVIIANNVGATDIVFMNGNDPTITIPSVFVSKNTGDALKAALLLGTVNATLADPEIIVSDNCDSSPVVTFSRYGTLGSCPNSFTLINTWTAIDACGNATSASQTITVEDNTPPDLTVPGDVTLECSDMNPQFTDRLTVNSPLGIAGDYLTAYANFGPLLTSVPVTADLQLANDGALITSDACEIPLADLTGKIALIDRGNCTFVSKVLNAQNAGALAVIIVNNSGTDVVTALGGSDPAITIPSVMVSKNTGDALKAALLLGSVNVTLSDPEIIVSDNCDTMPVVSTSQTFEPGSCPNSFTRIITWTATDACGNTTSASQTITIEDKTAPELSVVDENTVECSDPTIPLANRLTVNSTVGAGDYLTGIGTFAAQLNSVPLTANLALASGDGCAPLADLTGKVALIDRGTCAFADKVQNAKDAGALAVIIANNDTVNPDTVINVGGPYEVQLPMVFVSYNTGLALKNAMLSETVNVSLFDNDITVNDNCDVMPIVMISDLQIIPGTCDNEGDVIYTYTATDACGNASSVIRTIHIIDTTPPVIVCPDQEPYTRSTDSGLCTYKVVADEFDAIATDNCTLEPALSWVVSNPNATTQNGIDTLADVELQSGINTITWTADDGCGNTSSCSFIVNVDKITTITTVTATPSTQQYSDKVTFDVTVTPGDCSGARQAADFALIYVGTQLMGKAPLTVDGFGNLVGTLDAALLENPAYPSNGQMSPGLKTVKAVFMGVNPNYTVNDATTDLTITQENANVDYTGQSLQATPSASASSATVVLSANIQDIADGYRGDIRNAKVKFVNRDTHADISGWIPVVDLIDPSDATLGTVSFPWSVDIGASNAESYTVGIVVDNGYYLRNSSEDDTVITVYKPVGDFITGGGHIRPDASAGQYASTDGLRTNFGFNVGYNKKGNKLKGHMNVIFRRLESDGIVHVYQIKANAIQSLGVNISDPEAKFATFITKTNLMDITDPLNPISLGGNLVLKVDMTDRGEPGTYDSISFNLTNGGTLIYSSNWTGISTQEMVLSAGNLLVHSGYSVGRTDATASTALDTGSGTFELQAWPNPSKDEFYVKLNSANKVDNVEIVVYDINGRQVYYNAGKANEEYRFGSNLESGMYFVNITQANESRQVKLIKY